MTHTSPPPYPADMPHLTAMRFVACFMVVLFHLFQTDPNPDNALKIFAGGYLWVDFFFVLSGFILAHAYGDALRSGTITVRQYLVKRLARIYPVHLVTLLLAAGVTAIPMFSDILHPARAPAFDFVTNALLVHGWGVSSGPSYNTPSWSISAEWFAYACFPLILGLHRRWVKSPVAMGILAVFLLAAFWLAAKTMLDLPLTDLSWNWGILRIIPAFFLGVAAYALGKQHAFPASGTVFVLALTLVLALNAPLGLHPLACTALFAVLILATAEQSRRGTANALSTPWAVWLGEVSYAMYMVHVVVIGMAISVVGNRLDRLFSPDLAGIFFIDTAIIATIAVAALIHHAIEKPARHFINARFAGR